MKYFILPFLFLLNHNVFTQIKFVDAHDHVLIPPESGFKTFNIDINEDTQDDVVLFIKTNDTGESLGCQNAGGSDWHVAYFASTLNAFGLNKVNSKTNSSDLGIDCTNDTLSVNDTWKETAKIYKGFPLHYSLCENVGYGPNKQGVRLTKVNPSTGALGFIYGYIDYTITNEGEIILHGWYYGNVHKSVSVSFLSIIFQVVLSFFQARRTKVIRKPKIVGLPIVEFYFCQGRPTGRSFYPLQNY